MTASVDFQAAGRAYRAAASEAVEMDADGAPMSDIDAVRAERDEAIARAASAEARLASLVATRMESTNRVQAENERLRAALAERG